jgi:hypothetical protein
MGKLAQGAIAPLTPESNQAEERLFKVTSKYHFRDVSSVAESLKVHDRVSIVILVVLA